MKVLVSFANPKMGAKLFGLARALFSQADDSLSIIALHVVSVESETEGFPRLEEDEIFKAVREEAAGCDFQFETVGFPSNWVVPGIVEIAKSKEIDLLLLGAARSLFSEGLLGGKVGDVLRKLSSIDIAVLADNGLHSPIEPVVLAPGLESAAIFPLLRGLSSFLKNPIPVFSGSRQEDFGLHGSHSFRPWLPFSLAPDTKKNLAILDYETYKSFHSILLAKKDLSYLILRRSF
ncbi:universal stress family protein [Leptospira inadai serovar Lyme str. 10]|uniref:Universal stress family protein n=2 Tax=Leptospira inadai serovar Lyme TaxID=293084 RepID=V6HS88_9LEPT|nr:potassium transporter Kef [Leptospira inadai]EQA35449.1 universal stress family protein [Leptospira inadai serovar Lyme str. 10]PNV73982.1 potassium transporter Kef [Leptospira inadai serovar Lyme]